MCMQIYVILYIHIDTSMYTYVGICRRVCVYIYIYIYMYRERETHIYIYIYINGKAALRSNTETPPLAPARAL